ncbi:unnamed protein product [Prorocentrum cordatum]|uniref:Uncharacterized protein n=1 Tax=Prorocentrum cordatum TaxID=2364126 RepID=A0ABN9XDY6_9DINO|nr:unnamed protein product [Polarella glacialis]
MAADGADSFPGATELEIARYRRARPDSLEEASQLYPNELAWRSADGSPENLAAAAASVHPQFVRAHGTALDGSKIILVQGGRYDSSIDVDKYVLTCPHVLDQIVRPDSDDLVTLLIDVRPHTGWPNPPAPTMFPFFKKAAALSNTAQLILAKSNGSSSTPCPAFLGTFGPLRAPSWISPSGTSS